MKKLLILIALLPVFSMASNSSREVSLCGFVSVTYNESAAIVPTYTLEVPNLAIPEYGYSKLYTLVNDNTPVLTELVDGNYHCVVGHHLGTDIEYEHSAFLVDYIERFIAHQF